MTWHLVRDDMDIRWLLGYDVNDVLVEIEGWLS